MRISTTTNNDTTGSTGKAFGFERTPEAFQLLSSTLYSNKPKAIIRELACNALDAHVAANRAAVPFEVKIPNSLDSQFYVKDFGPGLSHDDVLQLYTSYFKSTKQKSDDFIGGFGVGSKSPFAYTDSFTVESRHEGKKRIYSAFLNDAGIPEMSMMMEVDSDEPSGLTVGFPVRAADFAAFAREAQVVFDVFPVKPTALGIQLHSIERGSVLLETPKFTLRSSTKTHSSASVVMGAVEYPLTKYTEHLRGKDAPWQKFLVNSNVTVRVPVGSLSVAVSREDLSYDAKTRKELPGLLKEALLEAFLSFNEKKDWTPHRLGELSGFFGNLQESEILSLLNMFPEQDLKSARESLLGIAPYQDLPAVEVVALRQSNIGDFTGLPKHTFGMPKQRYPLYDHALKYPKSGLSNAWREASGATGNLRREKIECVMMSLPGTETPGRMLAVDLVSSKINNAKSVVLLVPAKDASLEAFAQQAAETLSRWELTGSDMTAVWQDAYEQQSLLRSRVAASAGNAAINGRRKKSSNFEKNWCVPIDMSNFSDYEFQNLHQKIAKGADEKAIRSKTWSALPPTHPQLEIEKVLFIEYDVEDQTYAGMTHRELIWLLNTMVSDLDVHGAHVAVVPKNSKNIHREHWTPFIDGFLSAYSTKKDICNWNERAYALGLLHADLQEHCPDQWTAHPAAALFKELPSPKTMKKPSHYLGNALELLTRYGHLAAGTSGIDAAVAEIEKQYPLLPMFYENNRSHQVKQSSGLAPELAQHLLDYIDGKTVMNNTGMAI